MNRPHLPGELAPRPSHRLPEHPATRFNRRGIVAMVLTTASLVVAGYVLACALGGV